MNIIKAIVIDDEKNAREVIRTLVELYCPEVKIIADASNIKNGKELIQKLHPDLIFLDIKLGEDTGFDLIETLAPFNFQLIFTTAYSEFAIKAFRVNALDYLLKPINPQELKMAIEKVEKSSNYSQLQNQLQHLAQSLDRQKTDQLAISNSEGITYLETKKIIHIEGSGNYSTFKTSDGEKAIASKSLKYFESLLPSNIFYRCHQSHLVNLQYIKKILTKDGNTIELKNGNRIPFAKKRKEELLSLLSRGL